MAYSQNKDNKSFVIDTDAYLHDSTSAVTASAAGTVDGVSQVLDVGNGYFDGKVCLDFSAISTTHTAGDQLYRFQVQGSTDSAMATANVYDLAEKRFGAGEVLFNATATKDVGAAGERHFICFENRVGDTPMPYIRIYVTMSGTTPSVTYKASLVKG